MEKIEKPECYTPNSDPYPLCEGKNQGNCKDCCLYEDMDENSYPYNK